MGVKELRLLIGNTTNRETLEQLAEGYRRLELVAEAAEAEAYPKRTDTKRMAGETAGNIRSAIELMTGGTRCPALSAFCGKYPKFSQPILDEIDRVLERHYRFTAENSDFVLKSAAF